MGSYIFHCDKKIVNIQLLICWFFFRLIHVTAEFSLKTVHLKSLRKSSDPDCYRFDIFVSFNFVFRIFNKYCLMFNVAVDNVSSHFRLILTTQITMGEWTHD